MNTVIEEQHTFRRYDKELVKLKNQVDKMGHYVSNQIELVLDHLDEDSEDMEFDDVYENDVTINGMEVKASKTVIRLLAKQAPVGKDLRFIIAVSRIVTELERIGDEVVTIARSFGDHSQANPCMDHSSVSVSVASLLAAAKNLLDRALLAAQNDDVETATNMINHHLAKEGTYYEDAQHLVACIKEHHDSIDESFNAALQANSLKRICDHICNICEHTIFLVSGEDIRHKENDLETP